MPKFPKHKNYSALKKARKLILKKSVSESEDSTDSEVSEGYSHVPLKVDIPLLTSLSIGNSKETENDNMEQLTAQVGTLTQLLEQIRTQQEQQQQTLNALSQGQAQANAAQNNTHQQNANAAVNVETLFKIPDPIKSIPKFDGNRKQLSAWLNTAETTLNVFKDLVNDQQYTIFVTAVINKIEGRAKDIICLAGNPQSFAEVKEILSNALGDRQELTYYKSQLWQTKMTDNMSVHKYHNRCKEIVQNIKSLAKQKQKYKDNWDAINSFIEEDALAAFLAGLKEPYFGYAQAARPDDMEAAYAFVCKFKCTETTASNMEAFPKKSNFSTRDFKSQDRNFKKPQFDKNKTEKVDSNTDPQPMEIGSTKSKLTLNRRQVNNNEITDSDKSSESECEQENVDINFCLEQQEQNTT